MKSISLAKLHAVAPSRKPGYLEAVMAVATPAGSTHIDLPSKEFACIRKKYGDELLSEAKITSGPGVELKKLLKRIGIVAAPSCSCNARAKKMDVEEAREPGWCEAHIDTIVGWLREEATKRGLPFLDVAGRMLVRRAIKNARKAAS